MSGELTDKTHVLVTRLGDFWVKQERGAKIMALKQQDPNAQFEMDGSYIVAVNIDGLLTAGEYNNLQCKRRGMWQCKYSQWHGRNEDCYCGRNLQQQRTVYTPVDERKTEMTDEQKAAAKQRLDIMRQKVLHKKMRKGIVK